MIDPNSTLYFYFNHFLDGNIDQIQKNCAGISISYVFCLCVDEAIGNELDRMGFNCLGISRMPSYNGGLSNSTHVMLEGDDSYRARLKHYSLDLDSGIFLQHHIGVDLSTPCNHKWTNYHGLFEQYEYCSDCGVRK